MPCSSCGSNDVVQKKQGKHLGEYCASCDKWLRWVPGNWKDFIWPVGTKHKGKTLGVLAYNDRPYLIWAAENMTSNPRLMERAKQALEATGGLPAPYLPKQEDSFEHITRRTESRSNEIDSPPW